MSEPLSNEPTQKRDFTPEEQPGTEPPSTNVDLPNPTGSSTPKQIGQYELIKQIGRGGMGVVYLARQQSLNREVAIKIIPAGVHADPDDLVRFRGEAQMAASLRHPNIVQVYEVGEQGTIAYLVMEYIDGGTLHHYINNNPISPLEAARFLEQIARGIHYAHQFGIIHRDLKPGNILLVDTLQGRKTGPSDVLDQETVATKVRPIVSTDESIPSGPYSTTLTLIPKITDFGLAKQLNRQSQLTATGVALGTPSYMAPEQARGDTKNIGPLTDVYALGAILYEMLTGKPPFAGINAMATMEQVCYTRPTPPNRIRPSVPPELEKICLRCLEKQPRWRYPSAEILADDLRRFINQKSLTGQMPVSLKDWIRLRPTFAGLMFLGLLILIGLLFTVSYWKIQHAQHMVADVQAQLQDAQAKQIQSQQRYQDSITERIQLQYLHAQSLCEQGDLPAGMEVFRKAKQLAEQEAATNLLEILRRNQAIWQEQSTIFQQPLFSYPLGVEADSIRQLLFSRDGILWIIQKDVVQRFDPTSQKAIGKRVRLDKEILSAVLHPSGRTLFTGGSQGQLFQIDGTHNDPKPIQHLQAYLQKAVRPLLFSHDGQTLIVFCDQLDTPTNKKAGALLWNWSVPTTKPVDRLENLTVAVHQAILGRDDSELLLACADQTLRFWKLQENIEVHQTKFPKPITALAGHPKEDWILLGFADGSLCLWNRTTTKTMWQIPAHAQEIRQVDFLQQGSLLVSVCVDGSIRFWDTSTGLPVGPKWQRNNSLPVAAANIQGTQLATMSKDRQIDFWPIPLWHPQVP